MLFEIYKMVFNGLTPIFCIMGAWLTDICRWNFQTVGQRI